MGVALERGVMLRFRHRTSDLFTSFAYLPLSRSRPPYHTQIPSDCLLPFLLIRYHLYRRSSLALSSGALLISSSVAVPLSLCMIHRLTKRWYCRPWTMSPSPYYFIRSSPSAVYKDVLVATWTLSLSFRAIETSEPESKELHKSVDFPVSLLSAAA